MRGLAAHWHRLAVDGGDHGGVRRADTAKFFQGLEQQLVSGACAVFQHQANAGGGFCAGHSGGGLELQLAQPHALRNIVPIDARLKLVFQVDLQHLYRHGDLAHQVVVQALHVLFDSLDIAKRVSHGDRAGVLIDHQLARYRHHIGQVFFDACPYIDVASGAGGRRAATG